ncbi:hypothetical protein HanXRQr2_Chr11g0480591 [Helianthus annuus]|uniref:Uncharacterized protein n=1 Tax=Helianthus annuus TaxID=4232 RepID=A0A9K3MZA6_HELAN|nr:hypothetical protein HanXRQr2_Chr11g0480591 [Helianthus annuus]
MKHVQKTCRMSVPLAVRSRSASNYDETRTNAKNGPNYATSGILSCHTLK